MGISLSLSLSSKKEKEKRRRREQMKSEVPTKLISFHQQMCHYLATLLLSTKIPNDIINIITSYHYVGTIVVTGGTEYTISSTTRYTQRLMNVMNVINIKLVRFITSYGTSCAITCYTTLPALLDSPAQAAVGRSRFPHILHVVVECDCSRSANNGYVLVNCMCLCVREHIVR
jgi:hypothetical protein